MGESKRKEDLKKRTRHQEGQKAGRKANEAAASMEEPTGAAPAGLGGWLWLVQLGLALQLAVFIAQFAALFYSLFVQDVWGVLLDSQSPDYEPMLSALAVYELAELAGMLLFTLLIQYRFYRMRADLPKWITVYLLCCLAAVVLEYGFILLMPSMREQELQSMDTLPALVRTAILAAVWIPYFRRSRRVKNTFIA